MTYNEIKKNTYKQIKNKTGLERVNKAEDYLSENYELKYMSPATEWMDNIILGFSKKEATKIVVDNMIYAIYENELNKE